jgi:uncharacterized protein GlcG (DUF336 family)
MPAHQDGAAQIGAVAATPHHGRSAIEWRGRQRRPTRVFSRTRSTKAARQPVTLPGVFASLGGLPIMVDDKVTGAVGVSGGAKAGAKRSEVGQDCS